MKRKIIMETVNKINEDSVSTAVEKLKLDEAVKKKTM